MKNSFFKKLVTGAVSTMLALMSIPAIPSVQAAGKEQETGTVDGYDWELWNQYGQGTATMNVGNKGTYSCSWSGIQNVLFRSGKKWNNNPQWTSLDGIAVDYEVDYKPNGNSYLCIYGWMTDPTVEYYICDSYGTWRPPGDGFQLKGTKVIDGGTYEIYEGTHTGPSIFSGNETFNQYWSIRVDGQLRTSGTITVSEHFKAWEECGIKLGGLHEVALNVEGWQSSGSANVTKNDLRVGFGSDTPPVINIPTVEPDADGNYFKSTFDSSSTDKWKSRGDASIDIDKKNYYSADGSLFISGRTDNWHGASYSLDPSAFVAGKTYSFSAGVLQKSGETTPMQLTLQYTLNNEENYEQIAVADVKSGEWTKLENTSFEIPAGATSALIYVEAPESLTDFYIDDVQGSVAGTKSKAVTGGGTVEGATATTPPATTTAKAPSTTNAPQTTTTANSKIVWGDANCDGVVEIADATLILQYLTNKDEYQLTERGMINADVDGVSGVTANDALVLQQYDAGIVKSLPLGGIPAATTTQTTTIPEATTKAPANKVFLRNSFDSSTEGWSSRGEASVTLDSENYYSGKSLFVSGRTDNWHGAAIELDPAEFKAGNSYSFSAAVMQRSGSTTPIQLTLQYTLNGEDNYDQVASANVKSGEWTKLENTSFKIPEGAENLILYVEAPESLTDFYIDEVQAGLEGAKSIVVTGNGTVSAAPVTTPPTPSTGGVDISWIDPSKPMVAISFDDGASPATGNRIVNALDKSGFHATFFYVGDWIGDANGEAEVKSAYQKGMEIANHTKSHPNLSEKTASEVRNEYDQCAAKLKGIIGTDPSKLLRLPYLASNATVTSTLSDVPMITCAVDTQDWNGASKEQIVNTIKNGMSNGSLNGSIVLCHETYESTAAAIEELAPYMKSQGWQIVTISEMFAVKNQHLEGGKIYTKVN